MSKIWIREIIPIVVFHHMFESIQVSGLKISVVLFQIAGPM